MNFILLFKQKMLNVTFVTIYFSFVIMNASADELVASLNAQSVPPAPPRIVVSVEPLYEIVSTLSHGIVKPQVIYLNFNDRYKVLSNWQKELINSADIIIRAGEGFEPVLDEYLKLQGKELENKTITLSKYIPLLDKEDSSDDVLASNRQEKSDLRFWMDPRLVKMLAIYIAPRLVAMDPEHQEEYLDNEIILKDQLKKIEKKMLLLFKQLSVEQKILFAQFNPYLKNRYMSFSEMKKITRLTNNQPEVLACIQGHSFDAIPLNLEYTEKALYSLLHTLEQCSKTKVTANIPSN
ncbi:MAG: metal ABC transporter substrate-binding protein [Gammaproteobacteria bacterium]|nr:metal ABC transporter substrate-binding protein [Gammaproteobacteria bacterium]